MEIEDKWNAFSSLIVKLLSLFYRFVALAANKLEHQMRFAVSAKANELSGNSYTFKLTKKEEIIEFVQQTKMR